MEENITLWKDKATKKLEPTLFSKRAEELAEKIGKEGKEDDSGRSVNQSKHRNKNSQVRRYYDEVVRLSTQVKAKDANMDLILPQVHMLVAKVVYAKGRNLVTNSFVEMMKSGIYKIEDKDDLLVFANFLESFIGFYKMYGPK